VKVKPEKSNARTNPAAAAPVCVRNCPKIQGNGTFFFKWHILRHVLKIGIDFGTHDTSIQSVGTVLAERPYGRSVIQLFVFAHFHRRQMSPFD